MTHILEIRILWFTHRPETDVRDFTLFSVRDCMGPAGNKERLLVWNHEYNKKPLSGFCWNICVTHVILQTMLFLPLNFLSLERMATENSFYESFACLSEQRCTQIFFSFFGLLLTKSLYAPRMAAAMMPKNKAITLNTTEAHIRRYR